MPSTTKLPPYAREVAAGLAAGKPLNVYVFAGRDAWEKAKLRRKQFGAGSAVVAPEGSNVLDWRVLRGLSVVLRATAITPETRMRYLALSAEMIRAGVRFVAATDGNVTFAVRPQKSA